MSCAAKDVGRFGVLSVLLGACAAETVVHHASGDETTNPPIELDPSRGSEIGWAFEAFMSPHQEPGEEEETPGAVPKQFKSTESSTDRLDRASRGHGVVRFSKDLSTAWVDVAIEGIDPSTINMFHLHCGRPDQLGPIMADFGHSLDLPEAFADGTLSTVLDFRDLLAAGHSGGSALGAFLNGCPIVPGEPTGDHKTISGMKYVADQGDLYFNLHTTSQTYFGDIRGRLHPMPVE